MSENIDTNNDYCFCCDENILARGFKTLCQIVMVVLH